MAVPPITRVSPWRALGALFLDRERFVRLARDHALALCIEKSQFRDTIANGGFPNAVWETETKNNLAIASNQLVRSFCRSLLLTIVFFAGAIGAAMLLGRISLDQPLDIGKALSFVGAFLAGWATLFELGGYVVTYSGNQLHELLHPVLFRIVFLPGLAIAALGQVW